MQQDVFAIAPATFRPFWVMIPVACILFGVFGLLGASIVGSQRARFEVSEAGLRLRGDLYGRLIPAADLRADAAREVDLTRERDLAPSLRTMGTGLPGYQAGWFRLHNGEKALLYVTDRRRAVYVPTRLGYSVLLTPREPAALLDALRRMHGR